MKLPPAAAPPAVSSPLPPPCDKIIQWEMEIRVVQILGFMFVGITFTMTLVQMDMVKAAHQNIRRIFCWRARGREKMSILGTFMISVSKSGILLYASFQLFNFQSGQVECQTKNTKESSNNLWWSLLILLYASCVLFFYCVVLLSIWVFRNDSVETGIFEKSESIYDQRRKSQQKTTVVNEDDESSEELVGKKCFSSCLVCLLNSKQIFDAWFSYEVGPFCLLFLSFLLYPVQLT